MRPAKGAPRPSPMPTDLRLARLLARRARELRPAWAAAGYPLRLDRLPRLVVNPRFTRSLARFDGRLNAIELRPDVARWPGGRLRPVLTHELAHAAVFLRHGTAVRAHGAQWRWLMEIAGVEASARVLAGCRPWAVDLRGSVAGAASGVRPSGPPRYEHRCPVCQMVRIARRPVPGWRCRDCVGAGLEGRLAISVVDDAR